MEITQLVNAQRDFFSQGLTIDFEYRKKALINLKNAILKYENTINAALYEDLRKSPTESYMSEVGMVLSELNHMEKHLCHFCKDKRVRTPFSQFHAKSFVSPEPYGLTLIMSPWNYPFMLSISPIIGAIAAGNCVIIKPSAYSSSTSKVIQTLISSVFPKEYIAVVTGGREENTALLEEEFDYIFFTGSMSVGKLVMEKAAKHLTPVTLELGGKSPCIVDQTANLKLAAKRICFGKYLNAGQTCVAPDYLFVHESVKDELLEYMEMYIHEFFGDVPLQSKDLGKIINSKHFYRLVHLMKDEKIATGGNYNEETLQIEPTILDNTGTKSPIMAEEIFGPILPVITFADLKEVVSYVTSHSKPLAFYFFTSSQSAETEMLKKCSFGGGCINDTIVHLATNEMAFGGVGGSGMGSYHGKASFDTFTHYRSIVKKYNWIDLPIRYMPYSGKKAKLLHTFLK